MKRIVLLLTAAVMLVMFLAACGGQSPESPAATSGVTPGAAASGPQGLEFVYLTQDMANPYFVEEYNGFAKACEELGIKVSALDAKYDVATQVTYLEDCIEKEIDGIMITPLDENALTALVDKAKGQGIVIGGVDQVISNAQIDGSIDEYLYGVHIGLSAASWIKEKLNGKGHVLMIAQDDVEAVIARTDGIRDTITKECPETVIVARQNGSNTELAMSVTENVLTANPEVNIITTCDDFGGIGAHQAVKSMGRTSDVFGIFAADATAEGIAAMKEEGSVYRSSVNIFPEDCGYEMAYAMYNYIKDGKNVDSTEKVVVERRFEPLLQTDVLK